MTRPIKHPLYCRSCSSPVFCARCGVLVPWTTPMHDWIRALPAPLDSASGYTATDVDLVWRNWREGWFKLLEFKRGEEAFSFSQKSTLLCLDELLRGRPAYRGLAVIRTETGSPADSLKVWIEEAPDFKLRLVTKDELKEYLRHGRF